MLVISQGKRATSMPKSAIAAPPDAAGKPVRVRGDGVRSTRRAVVTQQAGLDTEDLLHRPAAGPAPGPEQRRRRGQPVGHQHLDHLTVRQLRPGIGRAQGIDDPRNIQPAQTPGSDGQSPRTLGHHGLDHALRTGAFRPWPRGPGTH